MTEMEQPPIELVDVARDDPDAIDFEEIDALLEHEWEEMQNTAYKVLGVLAVDDHERVIEYVDAAIDGVQDSYGPSRSHAALILAEVAGARPELVEPAIPALVERLDDPTPMYRYRPARVIAEYAAYDPEGLLEYTDDFVDALVDGPGDPMPEPPEDPNQKEEYQKMLEYRKRDYMRYAGTREVLANVLVELARVEPSALSDRASELKPILEDEVLHVRGGIVEVFRHLAEHDPAVVEPAIDPLIARLDDHAQFVRARTIRALGFATAEDAIEPLREVAAEDDIEAIRELAEETADFLESAD